MRSQIVCRHFLATAWLLAVAVADPISVAAKAARPDRDLCKQVRAALKEGRTVDQIVSELGTDEEHVTQCLQPRSRRRSKKTRTRKQRPKSTAAETKREQGSATAPKPVPEKSSPRPYPRPPAGTRVLP